VLHGCTVLGVREKEHRFSARADFKAAQERQFFHGNSGFAHADRLVAD